MPLTNITIDIGSGTSIVGPEFWAHSGLDAKIIGMGCGFAAAMFLVGAVAAKWLSQRGNNQASSTGAVELTNVISGGEPSNREPAPEAVTAPAAGTRSGPQMQLPVHDVQQRR
ncbi:hypothetical protein L211DRAFT_845016 [Terfezia boudieri ATCC MYA-4762]|uniref:Uncharacterized protein n=1 Tax=Terfezia boudieri ATCC MYA-4762 TaxID=1051890 RepID=A0A3N4M1E2_9PEZI|nr:hypothetical protein L211DRAFT_845016 [Terfezia boudieri ATCC MYA-4762]